MVIETHPRTGRTGYWRDNPDGTRDWIETNAPPPQPDLEEEIVVEAH